MRFSSFPLLFAILLLLMSCSSNATIRESFHDHASRLYKAKAVEIFDVIQYKDPAGFVRWHTVGAIQNERGDWHLIWADYGKRDRKNWEAMEWPTEPWPRTETLEEARRLGVRYLERYQKGEVGAGVFFEEQNMAHSDH